MCSRGCFSVCAWCRLCLVGKVAHAIDVTSDLALYILFLREEGSQERARKTWALTKNEEVYQWWRIKKSFLPSLISPICFVVALRESPTGFFVAASYPVDKANRLSLAAKVNWGAGEEGTAWKNFTRSKRWTNNSECKDPQWTFLQIPLHLKVDWTSIACGTSSGTSPSIRHHCLYALNSYI